MCDWQGIGGVSFQKKKNGIFSVLKKILPVPSLTANQFQVVAHWLQRLLPPNAQGQYHALRKPRKNILTEKSISHPLQKNKLSIQ